MERCVTRATLRRIVLQNESKHTPQIIRSISMLSLIIQLEKLVNIYRSSWRIHIMGGTISRQNYFAIHPQKQHFSERVKMLEAKLGALEKRFKNLASSGRILESLAPLGAKASLSTPFYYIFRTLEEVMSLTAVTYAQSVSQATSSTTKEFVEILWVWNNRLMD